MRDYYYEKNKTQIEIHTSDGDGRLGICERGCLFSHLELFFFPHSQNYLYNKQTNNSNYNTP